MRYNRFIEYINKNLGKQVTVHVVSKKANISLKYASALLSTLKRNKSIMHRPNLPYPWYINKTITIKNLVPFCTGTGKTMPKQMAHYTRSQVLRTKKVDVLIAKMSDIENKIDRLLNQELVIKKIYNKV